MPDTPSPRRVFLGAAATGALAAQPACSLWPSWRNRAVLIDGLPPEQQPPAAPRELRGAWVATVANIDWPSRKALGAQAQRAEMTAILDSAASLRLNALLFQVRPSADALYTPSAGPLAEPWSEYLTGTQGADPGWDPLAEWIEGAHRRGIELHAWLNPYRAKAAPATSAPAPSHLSQRRPDLVKTYGNLQWMDPGEPDAAAQTLSVCSDLLKRYALDGLHIDDYFYPYPLKDAQGQDLPFPDEPSYQRLGAGLSLPDWRRRNVDELVARMLQSVRQARPGAAFSVSPFGIGKPALRPPGIAGFSQYDQLYADVERWLAEGWCDALVPQLYWPIQQAAQAFDVLLDYWLAQPRPAGRSVWAGLYTSRLAQQAGERGWAAQEILDQIALTRSRAQAAGHVHFSMVALLRNRLGLADALRAGPYAQAALPPAMSWLDERVPAAPAVSAWAEDGGLRVQIGARGAVPSPARPATPAPAAPAAPAATPQVTRHALWARQAGRWAFHVLPAQAEAGRSPSLLLPGAAEALVASSLSRNGVESPRVAYAVV